ncbi:hypothetical protein H6P81_006423 [Aristolochia fimbriata]|uniref:Uncharacterized protein n=1 Tax=Aristolochia fimbriata TaxID=158543 RepID=A0AAV7EYM7_ARIFI|nr:hypothetical protein H6P81_006423 [Aristolochia fimbriata]
MIIGCLVSYSCFEDPDAMATSNKFDLPSSSPEGSSYANGSRAYYAVSSLDRSGSLREAIENRTLPSQPNVSRSGSTLSHGDVVNLIQSLPFDLKQMAADQKFPRQGEIKRMITSALGISQDDALFGSVNVKSLPSSSQGEIRRVKAILSDGSNKASSRSKAFGEAALVVDKARQSSFLRKRSRSDVSFSERLNVAGPGERSVPGGSTPKMGSESHLTVSGFEVVPQKPDERGKSAVPSKRVRTSMVDMDVRASTLGRPIASQEKDKDMFRLVSGCNAIQPEEKCRTLATGTVEGWEKSKMRKKRSGIKSDISGSSASSKPPLDGERDLKWGIQQKPENDGRPRLSSSQGFRSALANGSAGVGKSEGTSQQSGLSNRSTRNDQDTGSPVVERRDRGSGLEKERTSLKAGSRSSPREENSAASPGPVLTTKMSASARAPRSSSGSLSKLSPNIPRQIETPEEFENSQSVNKLHSVNGLNRKRMASVRSPSPPVTHWVGQRPQKITRVARRTNFVPLVASHDEAPSVETSIASGSGADTGLGISRRSAANSPQQLKLKIDHISSTGLSESEESGAAENKGKDKVSKKSCDGDDKSGTSVQKITTQVLPSRKNKIGLDGDLGGGIRKQGRSGRGFASLRSTLTCGTEKPENGVTSKQMRSARLGSEKTESKAGRPPNKKLAERKAYMRQRVGTNSGSSDFAGESDDDHEELQAAANAALSTSNACSSTFWKQAEPVFRFVSDEDVAFLKQQILLAEGSLANIHGPSYGDPRSKGDVGSSLVPALQTHINEEACVSSINAMGLEDAERNIGVHDMIPLSMRMQAATIDIDEIEELCCSNHQYDNDYKLDEGFNSKENVTLENSLTVGSTASNGYRLNASRRYCDELGLDNLSQDLIADAYVGVSPHCESKENAPRVHCTVNEGVNYASMTLDEKILLELQSIGIFPELLPDLAPGEGDGISETITKLEGELSEQAIKSKKALLKLEKAVVEAKEVQERKFEQLAMDKLIGMAYEKYMAYWGPSASGGKSTGNKMAKRAALSFVKRVLSRCHKYENTGRSCFSEPSFKGLLAASQQKTLKIDGVREVGPANASIENAACPSEKNDSSGHISGLNFQCSQKMDGHDKYNSAAVSHSHLPEEASVKEDISTNRLKRRELLLDEVGASISLQGPSGLAGSLPGGVKGKRSERERDGKGHAREVLAKNGATPKVGRPALGSAKGERKTKSKPKQRTAQLSASVNSLLGQASGPPKATSSQAPRPSERPGNVNRKEGGESASRSAVNKSEAIDLSHLQLPEMDVLGGSDDLDDHGQDLGSWLNIEDDGLVDNDFMGLGIPMDDLSDLNMMV